MLEREGAEKKEAFLFAHKLQDLTSQKQRKAITGKQFTVRFYEEVYDPLLDDLDIDIHAPDVNSDEE